MHNGKWITLISVLAAVMLVFSGCSAGTSSTAAQTAQTASASNAAQATSDATYVQVQSIENGTITALVGTMTQPGGQPNGAGQQGAPSDQSQGSGSAPQGTPPAQPSGDSNQQGNPPQQPSGDNSQQGGQNPPDGQPPHRTSRLETSSRSRSQVTTSQAQS